MLLRATRDRSINMSRRREMLADKPFDTLGDRRAMEEIEMERPFRRDVRVGA